jgi:hypothetical protein
MLFDRQSAPVDNSAGTSRRFLLLKLSVMTKLETALPPDRLRGWLPVEL